MKVLDLDGRPVSLKLFCQYADGPVLVRVAPAVRETLIRSRAVVEDYTTGDEAIYGLNTGLGGNLAHRIPLDEIASFQAKLIEGRMVGVGPLLPEWVSRAALLSRIISAQTGAAGLSLPAFELMSKMVEKGLSPAIPTHGSIGAGDLVLAVEMGAALLGRGVMWDNGVARPANDALNAHGLSPAALAPKDALALANNSSVTIALAALALREARNILAVAQGAAALAGEGYGINPAIFDPRIHALRPASGQQQAARWFRRAFQGSSLYLPGAARSIQDALSFRVLAPLFGSARTALSSAEREAETELNGSADNPAVLVDDRKILSTPNFHTPALALALDTMAISMVHAATASAQRVIKLMSSQLSGLAKYLSPVGGAAAGYMPMQKTLAALLGEIRLYGQPASFDALAVSETVEDIAPHTPLAARKLSRQLELLRLSVAIEALTAAQAVDLRKPRQLGRAAARLFNAIRSIVPMLVEDRPGGPDVAAVSAALFEPSLVAFLEEFDRDNAAGDDA